VKRSKPPVLTSPWKIGFFVSLMLVAVGSSVAYFCMRKANMTWVMPQWTDWKSLVENATHYDGMIFQVAPLAGIIGFASLFSYVAITQAVRKYKSYLDSGLDYKQLLASIREIKDLDDESRFEKLENHPELKDFLTRIRGAIIRRTEELDEREKMLEEKMRKERDATARAESTRMESSLQVAAKRPDKGQSPAAKTANFDEIAPDVERLVEAGQQIAQQLNRMASAGAAPSPEASATLKPDMDKLLASLNEIRRLSATLNAMSEEARGVAINTATKAGSGTGTQADLIQLAEDVKDVAAKFGELSKSYVRMSDTATGCIQVIETGLHRHLGAGDGREHAIQTAVGKISHCVENLVSTLGRLKGSPMRSVSAQPVTSALAQEAEAPQQNPFELNAYGFETAEGARPVLSAAKESPFELPGIQKATDRLLSDEADGDMFADLAATAPKKTKAKAPSRAEKAESPERSEPAPRKGADAKKVELNDFVDLPTFADRSESPPAAPDADEAIDLYALGAVDYNPALHG
jgi:hypothetical protein